MVQTGSDVAAAFGITIAAGAATCIGGAVVFSPRLASLASKEMLSGALAFSAGVMIYVSFVEILGKSTAKFEDSGQSSGVAAALANICFFGGFLVIFLLDWIVHKLDPQHSHDIDVDQLSRLSAAADTIEDSDTKTPSISPSVTFSDHDLIEQQRVKMENLRLQRTGLMTALSIALHNFPEGLATFVATLDDPSVGAAFAIAIAIHNIPEGIAVAMPVFYATGSRWKGFSYTVISALAEPLGALLAWLVLADSFDDNVYGILFGLVGGMMICISFKELLPTAARYANSQNHSHSGNGHHHEHHSNLVAYSCFMGMIIMALSIVLFEL